MLDSINLERRGIPATVLGVDKLVNTTGKGMAKAQGYPTMQLASYPYGHSHAGSSATDEEAWAIAKVLAPQVERILAGPG